MNKRKRIKRVCKVVYQRWVCRRKRTKIKKEVLPGIEPGLLESESKVITITLQNQLLVEAPSIGYTYQSTQLDQNAIAFYPWSTKSQFRMPFPCLFLLI